MKNINIYELPVEENDMLFDLPFFNNNTSKPILELNAKEFQEFTEIIHSLKRENERDHELKINIVRSFLLIFLLKCKVGFLEKSIYTGAIEGLSYNTVNIFKFLLEKNYKELHLVKD